MVLKTETEFKHFFETKLLGDLKELEIKRLTVAGRLRTLLIFELILFIILLVYLIWFKPGRPSPLPGPDLRIFMWIIGSIVVLGIIFVFVAQWISAKFRQGFKRNIISRLVSQISPEFAYFPDDKIEYNEFTGSEIFYIKADRYNGSDLVTGNVGDIKFRFSWIHAQYRYMRNISKNGARSQWNELFRGIFFVSDFGKDFRTDVVVFPNIAAKYRLGAVGEVLQSYNRAPAVNMENAEFDKEYAVYSRDADSAKQILSTELRQWILDFRKKTKGRLSLSFTGSKMNIAVYLRKKLFEPAIFRKVTDYDFIYENFRYLMMFTGILESIATARKA